MSITHSDDVSPVVDEVVAILARIGGGVSAGEIEYQLRRVGRAVTGTDVLVALCHAEAQGLVTPFTWTLGAEAPR